jgi:hypothetical protein
MPQTTRPRLTKAYLRGCKTKMRQLIVQTFNLTDNELRAFLMTAFPTAEVPTLREEMIRRAIHWALDESIPDHMTA